MKPMGAYRCCVLDQYGRHRCRLPQVDRDQINHPEDYPGVTWKLEPYMGGLRWVKHVTVVMPEVMAFDPYEKAVLSAKHRKSSTTEQLEIARSFLDQPSPSLPWWAWMRRLKLAWDVHCESTILIEDERQGTGKLYSEVKQLAHTRYETIKLIGNKWSLAVGQEWVPIKLGGIPELDGVILEPFYRFDDGGFGTIKLTKGIPYPVTIYYDRDYLITTVKRTDTSEALDKLSVVEGHVLLEMVLVQVSAKRALYGS